MIENGTRTTTFGYDSLYRLTSEALTGDSRGNNGSVGYGLDKVGNRESRTSSVPSVATTANTFNARDWLNTDTYDANGNTLTSTFSSVSVPDVYDFEDRLIIRHKADGSTVYLAYDADGILRQKTVFNLSATLVSATGYNSASPPSPFISVTSNPDVARFFAGPGGVVHELRIPASRAIPNPHNNMVVPGPNGNMIPESEYLVPTYIRLSEMIRTLTN